ncbi:hypothetical protein PSAC2689_30132 [Paraburkholderia sacchari]
MKRSRAVSRSAYCAIASRSTESGVRCCRSATCWSRSCESLSSLMERAMAPRPVREMTCRYYTNGWHACSDVRSWLDAIKGRAAAHKKKAVAQDTQRLRYFGSPTWARTRDLRINSPALYRLSYRGTAVQLQPFTS